MILDKGQARSTLLSFSKHILPPILCRKSIEALPRTYDLAIRLTVGRVTPWT